MQIDINQIRQKIIQKNGKDASLVKLSVVAKVLGYSSTEPIAETADKIGICVFKMKKYRVINKNDLQKLLQALLKRV